MDIREAAEDVLLEWLHTQPDGKRAKRNLAHIIAVMYHRFNIIDMRIIQYLGENPNGNDPGAKTAVENIEEGTHPEELTDAMMIMISRELSVTNMMSFALSYLCLPSHEVDRIKGNDRSVLMINLNAGRSINLTVECAYQAD